jgi:ATP-dependent helicase/nuclease subunit A
MKNSYPRLGTENSDFAAVFMSSNFRCDKAVVDFVNGVFDRAFALVGESIGYESGDRLGYAKVHDGGEPEYKKPEVCLVDKKAGGEGGEGSEDAPRIVARKIAELLSSGTLDNGDPIRPSDIAIIMRNARGKDERYATALAELGIPSCISGAKDFFLSPEVLLALCLLNSIDNPHRDIYLAGLMCSPLFGFTADELYAVRREFKRGTLYESLVAYTEAHAEFSRGKDFLEKLNYYRTLSECVGVGPLIYKLYHETGLLALAARNGGADNLTLLYDYARSYEAGAFKGLYNFIHFINNLTGKKDTEFDDKRDGASTDAVRIMTCHSSKGLEYPVVFLAECGGRITNKDARGRLVYSDELGLAFRLRTPSGLLPSDNPIREIVNLHNTEKMFEEELRILYVALTRARERLYLVGTSPLKSAEEYIERCGRMRDTLDAYSAKHLSSFLEIALVASGQKALDQYEFIGEGIKDNGNEEEEQDPDTVDEPLVCDESLASLLTERFTYKYPREELTRLPEKLSVSKASPTVLDGADEHSYSPFDEKEEKRTLPRFAERLPAEESAKRGIATHYLLQFSDLENLKKNGAEGELQRLLSGGFISKADAERVRLPEIEKFRESELFEKMLRAKKLYREFRFTLKLPASELSGEDGRIAAIGEKDVLVQGVIDCVIENPDGSLSLYDYKTDRLENETDFVTKYASQVLLYKRALSECTGYNVKSAVLYSFHLSKEIEIF